MIENPGQSAEPLGGRMVLLVDDEERLRSIIEMMLDDLGAAVVVAGDGASALETYRRRGGEISAVILDLRMHGLGGLAVLEQLREISPAVPVLLTSGAPPEQEVLDMIASRRCGFIEKPFDIDDLGAAMLDVIDGRVSIRRSG